MRSRDLEKLVGEYVLVEFHGGSGPETVRLRGLREPSQEEIEHGHSAKRVDVRRFLLGGYVDTWVLPRDVTGRAEPSASALSTIAYVEAEVGAKPRGGRS